jgi:hypothetical protein
VQTTKRGRKLAQALGPAMPIGFQNSSSVSLPLRTALAGGWFVGNDNPWPYSSQGPAPVLAAVGDISCQPTGPVDGEKQSDVCDKTGDGYTTRWQAQTATATQIESIKPTLVAILGDEQYEVGRYEDFMGSFDHIYGAFKFLQRPTPGNHEFYSEHGETGVNGYGYFDYYNGYHVNADTGQPSPTMDFGTSAHATASANSSSAPVASPWTRSTRTHRTSRPAPTSTTAQ